MPWVSTVMDNGSAITVRSFKASARKALEGWGQGKRVIGITGGQFSLIDLLRATLEHTGPAEVTLSAWTTGIRDAEEAAWLVSTGKITKLRWLIDRSFATRQPGYCRQVLDRFGQDAFVVSNNHAKFFTVENSDWHVCCRSSMNLNSNRRMEQFDLDDCESICRMFSDMVDRIEAETPSGLRVKVATVDHAFDAVAGKLPEQPDLFGVDAMLAAGDDMLDRYLGEL